MHVMHRSPEVLLASFFSKGRKETTNLVLLSAPSGAGKTTFCTRVIAEAREAGHTVGGLICPAVFDAGEKTAIEQVNVASNERRRLGRRDFDGRDNTIGCWDFDTTVLAWGNHILASLGGEDLIVIDEIGPLEFERGGGYREGLRLLDEGRYQAALVVVRPALLPQAVARWPQARVVHLEPETA